MEGLFREYLAACAAHRAAVERMAPKVAAARQAISEVAAETQPLARGAALLLGEIQGRGFIVVREDGVERLVEVPKGQFDW